LFTIIVQIYTFSGLILEQVVDLKEYFVASKQFQLIYNIWRVHWHLLVHTEDL